MFLCFLLLPVPSFPASVLLIEDSNLDLFITFTHTYSHNICAAPVKKQRRMLCHSLFTLLHSNVVINIKVGNTQCTLKIPASVLAVPETAAAGFPGARILTLCSIFTAEGDSYPFSVIREYSLLLLCIITTTTTFHAPHLVY